MTKIYETVTIYAVHEGASGKVGLASAQGTAHGAQVWAPSGKNFGPAFKYARRVDRSTVDETPEAAIRRFANDKREHAARLRKEASECLEHAFLAEELREESVVCRLDEYGVIVDTDRERVLAYLRASPDFDRQGQPYYPLVALGPVLTALDEEGLVRLVDYRGASGGCWMVDLLEKNQ